MSTTSPAELRQNYDLFELNENDLAADPIEQFGRWFQAAINAGVREPNAMTLATADASGKPDGRIVLLKAFDARGFVFYTNKSSSKGRELKENPRACLVFWWATMERQIRIDGSIEDVSRAEADAYFHTRPIESQIGAWASHQSTVVPSREHLQAKHDEYAKQFAGQPIPMPDYWGGYRLKPTAIEFWQGRPGRLHDRLRYTLTEGKCKLERLSP